MSEYRGQPAAGFTLTELLIVMVIAGILLALAAPSFQTMVANSTAENASGLIELDLAYARNNAITRGVLVRMTPASGGFQDGWTVQAFNGGVAGDVLRSRNSLDDKVTITSAQYSSSAPIGFTSTGQIETTGSLKIRTTGCTGDKNRDIDLMSSGQIVISGVSCP